MSRAAAPLPRRAARTAGSAMCARMSTIRRCASSRRWCSASRRCAGRARRRASRRSTARYRDGCSSGSRHAGRAQLDGPIHRMPARCRRIAYAGDRCSKARGTRRWSSGSRARVCRAGCSMRGSSIFRISGLPGAWRWPAAITPSMAFCVRDWRRWRGRGRRLYGRGLYRGRRLCGGGRRRPGPACHPRHPVLFYSTHRDNLSSQRVIARLQLPFLGESLRIP